MSTNDPTDQPRVRWVDSIRALGAFLVVLAHVQYSGAGSNLVWTSYYALTRVAVPLFFMASGFLLLARNESYLDFFRKRALKVFFPFIVWSVIYLLWKEEGFDQPFLVMLKSYFVKILRGPRENHLWFFYELFGLYLFTPILRLYVEKASIRDLSYFCGIWFLLTPVVNLVQEFTPLQIGFEYYFLNGYIGYFIFGYFATRLKFNGTPRVVALAVFFASLIATALGMYLRGVYRMQTQYFEDYLSVNVVLMSCSLFVVMAQLDISDLVHRLASPLSRASFGIYLAHVIVMSQLFSFGPFSRLPHIGTAIFMIPLLGFLGFAASFALIYVMQKIPILKYIVP